MPPENDKIFHIKLAKVGGIKYDYIFTVIKAIMHLVELRQAEGGANNFGVFRVKNHDFTPKKSDFFPNAEGSAKIFGVFRVKNHDFTQKKSHFFQF